MGVKFANNAFGTLNASIASGDASLTLSSGQGARFPSLSAGNYFYATLIDTSNNLEVVKCTARSSDVLTITRAQESTTARAFAVGDRVELRVTAAGLNDITTVNLDGDKGDITVSSDGATWSLDNDVVGAAEIADNAVGAAALNVSGNGTAGQVLLSDGDGTMSWGGAGKVLQVVQTSLTSTASYTGTAFQTITGLNTSITPSSTSSKILIMVNISQGENQDAFPAYLLKRGSTTVQIADSGSQTEATFFATRTGNDARDPYLFEPVNYQFLDSPSTTSATTYSVQVSPMRTANRTVSINVMTTLGDANQGRGCSTMILMEIAG